MIIYGDRRLPERFWDKVIPEPMSGCWLWMGCITKQYKPGVGSFGYGRFWPKTSSGVLAHRHAYQMLVADVDRGMDLDHLCRVRCCVNPAHLEPVTRAENIRRGDWTPTTGIRKSIESNRRRCLLISHCPRGHEYTDDNTRREGNARHCKECERVRLRDRRNKFSPCDQGAV